jgi:hypothetical protein
VSPPSVLASAISIAGKIEPEERYWCAVSPVIPLPIPAQRAAKRIVAAPLVADDLIAGIIVTPQRCSQAMREYED